jgi:NADPH-dependent glutamate synthase beta subunit-like oxidoreductase
MDTLITGNTKGSGDDHGRTEIPIEVNTKPVVVIGKEQTGLSIKEAAIRQGVNIKIDFVLSVEKGDGKTSVVGDADPIDVHPHEKFVAVDNDDNS